MSSREDFHGYRSGEKRKAEQDEATLGVAPKIPKNQSEKDRYYYLAADILGKRVKRIRRR
jgi:hypothetical protein